MVLDIDIVIILFFICMVISTIFEVYHSYKMYKIFRNLPDDIDDCINSTIDERIELYMNKRH